MNDPKVFLTRWSRRKRESAREADAASEAKTPLFAEKRADEPAAPEHSLPAQDASGHEIDPKTLPSLESIAAGSDVRAFLQRGVPPALARAALRRAWSADPTIRDFIGLSENSWDFTAPDAAPGFGPLAPEEIRRLAAQFLGESNDSRKTDHSSPGPQPLEQPVLAQYESVAANPQERAQPPIESSHSASENEARKRTDSDKKTDVFAPAKRREADIAVQFKDENAGGSAASMRRRHGGALPDLSEGS